MFVSPDYIVMNSCRFICLGDLLTFDISLAGYVNAQVSINVSSCCNTLPSASIFQRSGSLEVVILYCLLVVLKMCANLWRSSSD